MAAHNGGLFDLDQFDVDRALACVHEVEEEVLRIGAAECEYLRRDSQLTAALLLILRCASLFRSLIRCFQARDWDAFDTVHRAFVESWYLAYQFRLRDQDGQIGRWLARVADAWAADIGRLDANARARGHPTPNLGRDYGSLSELAHSTRSAAENSAALVAHARGLYVDPLGIEEAQRRAGRVLNNVLYRIVWLLVDQHQDFIPLGAAENRLQTAIGFVDDYPALPQNPA